MLICISVKSLLLKSSTCIYDSFFSFVLLCLAPTFLHLPSFTFFRRLLQKTLGIETHMGVYKEDSGGAWVAQLVGHPTSAQVMISRFVGSSPTSGSVRTARSLELASDSVSPFSLFLPYLRSISASQK